MNTEGWYSPATLNNARIIFSLSPTYLDTSADAHIFIKLDLHSEAAAFASIVLPLPGGPYNRIPSAKSQPS